MSKILGFAMTGLQLLALALHIWTVYIVFQLHGFIGAVIGLLAPVLSEIYVAITSWRMSGVFLTQYNYIVLLYISAWIVWVVLMLISVTIEEKLKA